MSVRARAGIELAALVVLSACFLAMFPERPMVVDAGLAVVALGLLCLNARYTKNVMWGEMRPKVAQARWRACLRHTVALTVPVVVLFLLAGIILGYAKGGWGTASSRILNSNMLLAVAVFLPWAFVQQTLFQFYLLGRLRALWPSGHALVTSTVNGAAFGVVHLPDLGVAVVTGIGGVAWSLLYVSYRLVLPLALSHGILGTTFYYWVYGQDLLNEWMVELETILQSNPALWSPTT